jgi:hypothetical protein
MRSNGANDGSVDADYAWGLPVATYLSTLQYLRLLLFKARLDANGAQDLLRHAPKPFGSS